MNRQFNCLGGPRDKALIALSSAPIHSPSSFSVYNHYLHFVSPRPSEELRKERTKRSMPSRSPECTEMTETPLDLHRNTSSISAQIGHDGHSQRRKKSCSSFTNVGHLPWARCSSYCNFHLGRDLPHRSGRPRRHRSEPSHEAEGLSAVLIL